MRVKIQCVAVLSLTVLSLSAIADGGLAELDMLVGQWLSTRSAIAEETRNWKEQENAWRQELDLLQREAESLQRHLDERADAQREFDARYADLDAQRERLMSILQSLSPALSLLETHLSRMLPLIPRAVAPELAEALAAFSMKPAESQAPHSERRFQEALALMAELERFQNDLHTAREMVTIEETTREMDVLYLGLARAYGVSQDNARAAIGVPVNGKWQWETRDTIAAEVRAAIAILKREQPARFVTLPLQIQEMP